MKHIAAYLVSVFILFLLLSIVEISFKGRNAEFVLECNTSFVRYFAEEKPRRIYIFPNQYSDEKWAYYEFDDTVRQQLIQVPISACTLPRKIK